MISLAIDANEANVTNRVGSNVYAFHLLQELAKLIKKDPAVSATVLLANPPVADLPHETADWTYQVITPTKFWTQLALPLYLFQNRSKFDLLFTPGHYAPRFSAVPYISSVMDLAYLHFPDQFKTNDLLQLKHWTRYSVKNARKIVTISQFSRQEIVNLYQKNKTDIVVAYPDVSLPQKPASQKQVTQLFKKYEINDPYFLFVGTLQPRKNLLKLIEAYELFFHENKTTNDRPLPKLVVVGKIGWLAEPILQKIKESPAKDQIVLTGFIADEFKPALYQRALATVLVGLYEGFGIPPLESMHFKTLPIVSNKSSLPEVVGQAGILVNPHRPELIAQGLQQAWQMNSVQKARYQQLMAEQIKKFSWQKSALKIFELLKTQASS